VVIEAIAERMDWKHDLYAKVAPYIGATRSSPRTPPPADRENSRRYGQGAKERFCGVHFFNPPRYMHLVELIPTPATRSPILDDSRPSPSTSARAWWRAKDTPNFIANRSASRLLATIKEAEKYGIRYDVSTTDRSSSAAPRRPTSAPPSGGWTRWRT